MMTTGNLEVSCGHFRSYCLEICSHMSKGKGQQVMEHNWFPLEFQLHDGKDALQTAQKYYLKKLIMLPTACCHAVMT